MARRSKVKRRSLDPIKPVPASTLEFARRLALQFAARLPPAIRAAVHADIEAHERDHPSFAPGDKIPSA